MIGSRLAFAALAVAFAVPAAAQPKFPPPGTAHPSFSIPPATAPRAPAAVNNDPDFAFAEYQRGNYVSAFREATRWVEQKTDPQAMTLLGQLYAEGLGVANDDKKAAEWYRLAAARGDREAMFALAMFNMTGRGGGPADPKDAVRLLTEAATAGHVVATYDLALLYLQGRFVMQDSTRAAELMQKAAIAGSPEAQYALATFYKEGQGVKKDAEEAARLLSMAARSGHTPAEIEYGIALFNGTGVARSESAAFEYFLKAAQKNNPVGQNRLAWMYATGRGIKADPVEAGRWHLIAKAGGDSDLFLDEFVNKMNPMDRAMAENKAKPWIARMAPVGPTPFPTAPPRQTKSETIKP